MNQQQQNTLFLVIGAGAIYYLYTQGKLNFLNDLLSKLKPGGSTTTPPITTPGTGTGGGTGTPGSANPPGTVIWTSKGIWDNGKDRTFTSTDPDDPDSQMRAGVNRSCHVDGKGNAFLSGARGRMYFYKNNYDFVMQFDITWNSTIDNIGTRGRSQHNEGGGCDTAFGGYGSNFTSSSVDFKSEDSHSQGDGYSSESFKFPQTLQAGQTYGIRHTLKDVGGKPTNTFEIDYKDGKGFVKIGEATDPNPPACRVNKARAQEISYLWIRTNGGSPKDVQLSNMIITDLTGLTQTGNRGSDYGGSSGADATGDYARAYRGRISKNWPKYPNRYVFYTNPIINNRAMALRQKVNAPDPLPMIAIA